MLSGDTVDGTLDAQNVSAFEVCALFDGASATGFVSLCCTMSWTSGISLSFGGALDVDVDCGFCGVCVAPADRTGAESTLLPELEAVEAVVEGTTPLPMDCFFPNNAMLRMMAGLRCWEILFSLQNRLVGRNKL